MDDQGPLFASRNLSRADQIFKRFVQFHKANPNFWYLFCRFADGMRQSKPHYSARAIFQRARWEMDSITVNTDDNSLKLNDHYSPYYARMYLAIRPQAKGFFELRTRTSEKRGAYKTDLSSFYTGSAVAEDELMEKLAELAQDGLI